MDDEGRIEPTAAAALAPLVFPIANDFSPGTPAQNPIRLQVVLKLVKAASGRAAQVEAIRSHYFASAASKQSDPKGQLTQQRQMASNVLIGMDSFKVYDEKLEDLTPLGNRLLAEPSEADADREFAKHILLELHGIEVLRIIKAMTLSGRQVDKVSLAEELNRRG
ncbi:hypothetical protein, partial [Phenylobacterium sp.]